MSLYSFYLTKRCSACNYEKPLDGFHKDKTTKDGHTAKCKACVRQYYLDNRERMLANVVRWRAKNPGKQEEYSRRWKERNYETYLERKREYQKKYLEKNPGYQVQYSAEYYRKNYDRIAEYRRENAELIKASQKLWIDNNRDKVNAVIATWRKNNPEKVRHAKKRRKARKKGATGSHSLSQWINLLEAHGHKCAHCQSSVDLTEDHIVPLSKGGSDYIENIQPLCRSCNSRKGIS